MAEPFVGEIRVFAFGIIPKGWAECAGQTLPLAQNVALFSILGTKFGGDGSTNFKLPDLRGAAPLCFGSTAPIGKQDGKETHTLTIAEMPAHTHAVAASAADATQPSPQGNLWAKTKAGAFAQTSNATMASDAIVPSGSGEAHTNMQPSLSLVFCIALQGNYPPHQ